ncbi:CPBP family intramembrane glutamic endopeptidase [Clostridium polynesiense]|uniref:CPBP family intramembrane glutamic endopeptidase n=1 Tax=Clostridium polynesiense TaxID=1325933 RepID=UPI00058ADEE9|nr:CPBP family intramembrane glutamic endopeptidase [Clostridium polynesiense]
MPYHTQFLKLIIVLAMVMLPLGLGSNVSYLISTMIRKKTIGFNLLGMVLSYGLIVILVWFAGYKEVFFFKKATLYFYLFAPFIGITCIGIEYLAGVIINFVSSGKWVFKISIHSSYSRVEKIKKFDILMIVLFAVIEELLYRQVLVNLLQINFNISEISLILVSSIVFAFNHINFGAFAAFQKLFSGLIFTCIYLLSGYSILVPAIAHASQNLSLLFASRAGEFK